MFATFVRVISIKKEHTYKYKKWEYMESADRRIWLWVTAEAREETEITE